MTFAAKRKQPSWYISATFKLGNGLNFALSFLDFSGGVLRSILAGKSFVLFSDLVEFLHVLKEIWTSLKCDEELCFLAISVTSWTLHGDCSGSDLFESGVVVSVKSKGVNQKLYEILT